MSTDTWTIIPKEVGQSVAHSNIIIDRRDLKDAKEIEGVK